MKTVLTLLAIVATYHFIYEGIVAPTLRSLLRHRLFVLRDRLRRMNIEGRVSEVDLPLFWYVHDGVNFYLSRLGQLTMTTSSSARRQIRADEELKALIDKRVEALRQCDNREIVKAFMLTSKVIRRAILVNSGGWFIYVVPVLAVLVGIDELMNLAKSLVVTPIRDTRRILRPA